MKKKEWFIIDDLEKFIESTRVIVYDGFGEKTSKSPDKIANKLSELKPEDVDDLNNVLSQNECLVIAKEYIKIQTNRRTQKQRMILDNRSFMKMIESFNSRMVGNILNNLVNKGMLETAFDAEENDFVFWVKDAKDSEKSDTD